MSSFCIITYGKLSFGLLDATLESFGRKTQLAAGTAITGFFEPTAGVGYLDAAFGTGNGDVFVFHRDVLLAKKQ